MRNSISVRQIVISGLFITMGLILPVIFHFFGLGSTFLPMHIPVLISGFILQAHYSVLVGAMTPLLSSVITGMPPIFPVMPYMVFELAVYAVSVSFLSQKLLFNSYLTLICSMISGRIAAGIAVWVMTGLFEAKLPDPFVFFVSTVSSGIPGIVIQLLIIPPIVIVLKKTKVIRKEVLEIEQ